MSTEAKDRPAAVEDAGRAEEAMRALVVPDGCRCATATLRPSTLAGTVEAIASKSVAHRLLVCAALADAPTRVVCKTTSQDIEATCACLEALGARLVRGEGYVDVTPVPRDSAGFGPCSLDCGESGSTIRFLLPVVGALGRVATVDGHGRLPQRPLEPLRSRMCEHGCAVSPADVWPVQVSGRLEPGDYDLPGNVSSQYVTGLLLAFPLIGGGRVRLHGQVESRPYIDLTIAALGSFGVEVAEGGEFVCGMSDGCEVCEMCTVFEVRADSAYTTPGRVDVEGDWSNAAFWLCAGAVQGSALTVAGLDACSRQGDKAVAGVLESMGALVEVRDGSFTVSADGRDLQGVEVDAQDIPDLVPVLAVAAATASGTTRFVNAGRLRIKESDRLQTTAELLAGLGVEVEEKRDGLVVVGVDRAHGGRFRACTVDAHGDHRIAMAAAVASLAADGPLVIEGAQAVAKSYPAFFADFARLGGSVELDLGGACGRPGAEREGR